MYENTLPLLEKYFERIETLTFVNVTKGGVSLVAFYDRLDYKLQVKDLHATWFNKKVHPFINSR